MNVYLNAAGSILGTFLGGFVLISLLPSGVILMGLASALAALSMLLYVASWRGVFLMAVCLSCGAWASRVYGLPMTPVGVQIDTAYNHISIVESLMLRNNNRRVRIMMTDPDGAQSLMYPDSPTELMSDYTRLSVRLALEHNEC